VAVSEEGLPNGVPDAGDTTDSTSASGTITASDVDGDALTMTLGTPTTSLTSGGVAIAWTLQDTDHTLVGKAGETTIITATITDVGAYNVTLSGPIDHPDTTQEDDKTLTIPVNVSDGHTTMSSTLSVSIEDDSPKAQPVEVSVDTSDSMTNVMLIIDVSGSMNSSSGVSGFDTRLGEGGDGRPSRSVRQPRRRPGADRQVLGQRLPGRHRLDERRRRQDRDCRPYGQRQHLL
jgi:T1SS-143 domain-containing protein